MRCSLAKLNGVVARRGAVLIGRNASVLCACPTVSLMAHSARGPRGGERACLRGCWDGGDHVCMRRGWRAVCGRLSRAALWRALGMVAERMVAHVRGGQVASRVRALDRGWRWMVECLLDKVGEAS